ncbi:polysaccharide pyruvyl transferase family protein [Glutamicibacter ardleyensis]|uniref:polysaccharide pyruvyl transferase family protein n=1 Tax=Glutamicibacter ardleyensis TaxID=225894 RepID=UPI003FD3B126
MYLGIITYQHTTNFGAALQAYALRKTCEDLGARAEIIDYRSPSMAEAKKHSLNLSSQTWLSRAKLILRKPLFKMKQRSFEEFSSAYMHLTEKTFVDSKQLHEGLPSYDVLIIGSDQVWNHEINGMDSSYFGNFAPSTMRIASYASSIGLTSISPLFQDEYGKGLKRIDPLSVRERSAATIIRNLTGQNAVVHADPVFLRSPAQWRSLAANQPSKAISDALVTYFIGSTGTAGERIIATSDLRMKRRVKLAGGLAMRDLLSPSISVRLDRGPIDFIQAIDNASFVLADSFHATAMSIILDKPFGVLLKGDQGKDARILDILRRFGLQDRVVRSADDLRFGVPSEDVPLEKLLNSTRLDSYDYLKEIL